MNSTNVLKAAQEIGPYVIDMRQALHKIPETRWQEEKTINFIKEEISQYSDDDRIEFTEYRGGLVVDVTFDPSFDRVLFRADIDGLPIIEKTGLPFASEISGNMHACGHDIHAAMLLGALKALIKDDIKPKHNIRLVWQRAEENPITHSGGFVLTREGVCDEISNMHALHIWVTGEFGSFLSRPGRMLANSDRLQIKIKCSGGHVAEPDKGSNAIDIGIDICNNLKGFGLRLLGPNEPTSIVPAIFQAGASSNTRPDTAELWFAVRNLLDLELREELHDNLRHRINGIANLYTDAQVAVKSIYGHPMLFNDIKDYDRVRELLIDNNQEVSEIEVIFGGEDFAYYLRQKPGSMWMLCAPQKNCGQHHTPTFNPDESVFWKGVLFWLLLATS